MQNVKLISGKFKGVNAELLGTDKEVLGNHLFKINGDIAKSYMRRFANDIPSVLGIIYIVKIDGDQVAVHESEIEQPIKSLSRRPR